jgi:hypothetical protein
MAARLAGSGANTLTLYDAGEWMNRVHLMHRDCGVDEYLDSSNLKKCIADGSCSSVIEAPRGDLDTVVTSIRTDVISGFVLTKKWDLKQQGTLQPPRLLAKKHPM